MTGRIVRNITVITALVTALAGCGGGEGGGTPISASTVTSAPVAGHTHTVEIPIADVSAAPAAGIYQYRTTESDGHSHVIALTKAQLIDLYNGERVVVTSSSPDSGADHVHGWNLAGGDMLYDRYCYGCHGNGKRGGKPMNVRLTADQNAAIRRPAAAPLSNAAGAVPDPTYMPGTPSSVTADGAMLYGGNCSSCHGPLSSTNVPNRTASQIRAAIGSNRGGMSFLDSLSDADLKAIAAALAR